MKNNLDYYQHYSNSHQHPKFKMLRVKYGWAGEGRFWALNNMIAEAENCMLDLNKEYNKASIAVDLGLSIDELNEFLQYLSENCNLIISDAGIITTGIVRENLTHTNLDREAARNRYYLGKKSENDEISPENEDTSEEKIYKLNQTKLNQTKDENGKKVHVSPLDPTAELFKKLIVIFKTPKLILTSNRYHDLNVARTAVDIGSDNITRAATKIMSKDNCSAYNRKYDWLLNHFEWKERITSWMIWEPLEQEKEILSFKDGDGVG